MHDDSKEKYNGTRNYTYEVEGAKTLEEAIEDFTNNFSIDNVANCNDSFKGSCLDSYTQSISIYEK